MQVLADLLVLFVFARILGEVAERLGLSASVGELTAGILLALAVDTVFSGFALTQTLLTSDAPAQAATLGIFFLVLAAGIELQPKEVGEHSAVSIAVAVGGVAVPLAAGAALAWVFLPDTPESPILALLVGTTLSVTALPATVKVLAELGQLKTAAGKLIVSAAVFDDVIGLFLLALLTAYVETGGAPDVAQVGWLVVKVVAFFAVTVLLGTRVYPHISRHMGTMRASALEFSALVAVAAAYGLLAEALDMHWILGAFVAGLFFEPSRVGHQPYNGIRLIANGVTSGVLAPLFFAYIGLLVDVTAIGAVPVFIAALCAVALTSKCVGAGVPALLANVGRRSAGAIALGMSARGGVGIVVVGVAAEMGVFDLGDAAHPVVANLYSSLILVTVVTTMIAPLALRRVVGNGRRLVTSSSG